MNELVGMMEGIITTFGAVRAADLARSPEWLAVRERYLWVSSRLLVNGHDALVRRVDQEYTALRAALRGAGERDDARKAKDDYALWESATEFTLTLKALRQFDDKIEAMSAVKASETLPAVQVKETVTPKRSWTQPELDEAIREYQAKRSARYQELVGIIDNPGIQEGRKKVARLAAQKMFGRNVIAEELGVKAAKMVSQSAAWIAIAEALDLPRKGGRKSAPGPVTPGKRIGLNIAVEKASVAAAEPSSDYTSADAAIDREEREATLREIRRLAESKRSRSMNDAKALLRDYQAGEMTDAQVRATVRTLMGELT